MIGETKTAVVVTVGSVVSSLASCVLGYVGPLLTATDGRTASHAAWAVIATLILFLATVYPAIVVSSNKLSLTRKVREDLRRKVLRAVGFSFGAPQRHIRANIMTVVKGGERRLVEASTAYGMDKSEDTDKKLEMDLFAGVSGKAAKDRVVYAGNLEIAPVANGPDWRLASDEQRLVRSDLKMILSAPIFDPTDTKPPDQRDILGTIQVDSNEPFATFTLDSPEQHKLQTFADIISLLLKEGA